MLRVSNVRTPASERGFSEGAFGDAAKKNHLVRKTFSLLHAFKSCDKWLTSQELSERADIPRASAHRLIQTLVEVGAIVRGPRGRYRLGMLLLSLSKNVASKEVLCEIGTPVLNDLAARLNLTVHLGMLENGMVFYVKKVSPPTCFSGHTLAGAHLEAYCSGLGKVLLAALDEGDLDDFILDGAMVALTSKTITEASVLRLELEKVRLQGFAFDDCESHVDTYCVAVPLRDLYGNVVAAISATGDAKSIARERIPALYYELIEAASVFRKMLYPDI